MITRKYKVHEAAKDFAIGGKELTSKDILSIIDPDGKEGKKYSTVMTEEELDLIFDRLTNENSVKNFMEFFAEAMAEAEKKRAELARKQEELAKKQAELAKKQAAQPKPAPAAVESAPAAAAPQPAVQPAKKAQPKPEPKKPQKVVGYQRPAGVQPVMTPSEPKKPKERVILPPQERVIRMVDTRSGVEINADKYSGRYEQSGPANLNSRKYEPRKQKINQRSRQQGRPAFSKKETEAEKLRRLQLEKARKQQLKITVPDEISVGELATRLKKNVAEVVKKLLSLGTFASASDIIDYDTAEIVAMEFNVKVEREVVVTIEERIMDTSEDNEADLELRSPVVVVMGHVDHGKTSLLDAIRKTKVVEGEAGGITQHIGAYRVKINGKDITFLDTPGHEAFTSMRARGANMTDIAVLVVAADDGIMPQTVEAINHAKAAGVSIIVAINKMDKPGANPEKIKQQLTEHELVIEEWGGDTPCVPVSAVTHMGIDELLETIILLADVKELKANPNRAAKGAVIEARLDKGMGPTATLLVQNGTLHTGDVLVAGDTVGRVRTMTDDKGRKRESAGPSEPVEVTGLDAVPTAGESFDVVSDERLARELVDQRRTQEKEEKFNEFRKVTLENLFDSLKEGEIKELPVIVKADVNGSVEAVSQSLQKIGTDEVRVKIIHAAVGAVNESDVMLAQTANAIIVGFNIRPDSIAAENAKNAGVDIRLYRVIYDCIDEITAAMKGMLAPKYKEVMLGKAEVRQVYKITGVGAVAGSYVREGKITRNAQIRLVRDGIIVADDKIAGLRRFKDDVKEVAEGYECGISLEKFSDIKEGDIFEAYTMEEIKQ
ncbi:MAG TPA: translation initiation factor IF-2 [Oscillospiraceae bacterium]|nr:translation initiation factor IF-2 [Oscillospiraceae bacterium]HPK35187.1 translation initiation factor IF-2 [Oscillospiraceae bacterium]HPR74990.1 translation initiation factor IF-2 [Oscillospiraceae bacterium]